MVNKVKKSIQEINKALESVDFIGASDEGREVNLQILALAYNNLRGAKKEMEEILNRLENDQILKK